ncbi:MAG: T9SS type A sorting domain-containing protein [Bacteroidales bacterium]|nr:T9SS type A sorting domain-containing protein [Bacteroidales bacterium]
MKFIFITILVSATLTAAAQSDLVTTGGDIQGSNGSVSYTVGQVAVQSIEASAVSLTEGVQQPYEIQTVGVDNYPAITLDATVYPNPTADRLVLSVENFAETYGRTSLRAVLHNTNGQYIQTVDVAGSQTTIDMSALSAGTYYLRVTAGQQTLKTFKVVKTM